MAFAWIWWAVRRTYLDGGRAEERLLAVGPPAFALPAPLRRPRADRIARGAGLGARRDERSGRGDRQPAGAEVAPRRRSRGRARRCRGDRRCSVPRVRSRAWPQARSTSSAAATASRRRARPSTSSGSFRSPARAWGASRPPSRWCSRRPSPASGATRTPTGSSSWRRPESLGARSSGIGLFFYGRRLRQVIRHGERSEGRAAGLAALGALVAVGHPLLRRLRPHHARQRPRPRGRRRRRRRDAAGEAHLAGEPHHFSAERRRTPRTLTPACLRTPASVPVLSSR